MNSLLKLKGQLHQKKNSSSPGAPSLAAGSKVTIDDLLKLKQDLENLYEQWKNNTLINGALISVYYKRVVPKSKRVKTLMSRGSESSNDTIVGARFAKTNEPKHIITHFIELETLEKSIKKLDVVIKIVSSIFNGEISNSELEKLDKYKMRIEKFDMSKSLFNNIIVDSSFVEKFGLLDNSDEIKNENIITIYETNIDIDSLMNKLGIEHNNSNKLNNNTIRLNKEEISILKKRAPYLIAMATTDLSTYCYEDLIKESITSTINIPNPTNEPTVGVIDTLFDKNVYFSDWVEYRDLVSDDIKKDSNDYTHGTAVTSIIVDGPSFNENMDDGCGRFRVKHFGVATQGANSSFTIMREIKNIIETNRDVRVWNLSLGSTLEINPNFISPEAALLDELQFNYDVIFIIAGTNKSDETVVKIGSPADSINSIVVNSVDSNGNPASYSRKGKVLSFFNKPDICYYGGDNNDYIKTCIGTGEHLTMGTSYAAPWITRKIAYMIEVLGLTRETAKALLIDSATQWKQIDDAFSDYMGFGKVPLRIENVINTPKDEIKFYIEGVSNLYDTYAYNIPVPLHQDKYPFIAKATLCYFPKCSRNQGVDYTNTELDVYFGRIDNNGKIKSINENKQSEGNEGYTTEKNAREFYRKWDNVKHITQMLKDNLRSKQRYENSLWGLSIKTKERLEKRDGAGINFGVVITLKEINGVNRIDEFINQCTLKGWLVNKVDVNNMIDIYNIAEQDIEFE